MSFGRWAISRARLRRVDRVERLRRDRLEVDPRRREQVADEPVHRVDLGLEIVVDRGRSASFSRHLDEHAGAAEGGAQLVRHGGHQRALVAELTPHAIGHPAERRGHLSDLGRTLGQVVLALEPAAVEVRRNVRELLHGPGDAKRRRPRQPPEDEQERDPDAQEAVPVRAARHRAVHADAGGRADTRCDEQEAEHSTVQAARQHPGGRGTRMVVAVPHPGSWTRR